MKFSLLMSIYHKEKIAYFDRAMHSIWDEQTKKPDEIILVQDGQLTDELYTIIDTWKNKLGTVLKVIALEQNLGTGDAKNIGLQACSYEMVAIMDTDDIAQSDRFEKQLIQFRKRNIDICSSWVSEFDKNENQIISYRKLPENHDEIVCFAKKRMPVNHPATMYKKSVAIQAGGYKRILWFEDYYLMVRMLHNGAKIYNIQEPLIKMRVGYEQLERRRGWQYAMNELELQKYFLKMGFIKKFEFLRNVSVRFGIRIVPKILLKFVYKMLRKDHLTN